MRRAASAIMFALLLVSMFALGLNIQRVRAELATITVPDDYAKIQWAVGNATAGDTVFVRSGTYFERLVVNKSLTLVGEDKEDTIIDGNWTGTVVKIVADDVSLTGFTIRNAGYTFFYSAVFVQNSSDINLSQNIMENSSVGIYFEYSNNSTITDNTVVGHYWYDQGIRLVRSNSCLVSGNDVSGGWAINLITCYNNTVTDNLVFSKGKYGIRLGWSHGNLIIGNTILNATSVYVASSWGLWSSYYSTDNTIFHNNFLNNTNQAHGHNLTNIWDNGYEGNYWSDYSGADLDGDGIGDTPYVIDVNNTDNHPLMTPYMIGDVNHDAIVDIFDVVLAVGAYLSTPLDPNWNPHCDVAESYGIIDIFDIVMIAQKYGREWKPLLKTNNYSNNTFSPF
ncbi:MAG: NosD domain-containing protein [Candidatus Bathyarchaeia archaeon]